jgi:hypothetical protein
MKTWGSGGIAPPILTSALDGGQWSALRLGRFTLEERGPVREPEQTWMLLREKTCICRESNPGRLANSYVDCIFLPSNPN